MNKDDMLKLEEVGAILGGDRPFSRETIKKLIRVGRLQDNGGERKLRRVPRWSVDALLSDMRNGGTLWEPAPRFGYNDTDHDMPPEAYRRKPAKRTKNS